MFVRHTTFPCFTNVIRAMWSLFRKPSAVKISTRSSNLVKTTKKLKVSCYLCPSLPLSDCRLGVEIMLTYLVGNRN
jgi:hypothetical protein